MQNETAMVALYDNHEQAENSVRQLQRSGYDMTKLSIVAKDYHTDENVVGYYTVGDRMKKWGATGAFWGGLWGILFGSAFFFIPGFGPLLIAGPLVSSLVGALEGAVALGGLSALGAALASIGIPKNSILEYETEVKAGKFMLLAHGNEKDVENARQTLNLQAQLTI
ncbi:MAG: general stress protein [Candidatus Kapaibacteriota bacterium]